jgi:hypothetical protein
MTTTPPPHVMRFYGNLEYAMHCIGFKEITFLHPDKLNDPFDPLFCFTTDFGDKYTNLLNWVQQRHAKDLQKFKTVFPKEEDWNSFINQSEDRFKLVRNSMFVFSTCAIDEEKHPKNNLHMWSHYGNGHRGIAIEFDTALLTRALLALEERSAQKVNVTIDDVWCKINYAPDVPKLKGESIFQYAINDREGTELQKNIDLMLRSKSMEWQTENEWRFMCKNEETKLKVQRLPLLDENTITAVYLGCLVSDEVANAVIFETKQNFRNANMFRGKKAKGAFALEFEQLF